jgi:hypothetical protein
LSGLEPKNSGVQDGGGGGGFKGKGGKGGKGGAASGSMRESDWVRKRVPKSFGERLAKVVEEVRCLLRV